MTFTEAVRPLSRLHFSSPPVGAYVTWPWYGGHMASVRSSVLSLPAVSSEDPGWVLQLRTLSVSELQSAVRKGLPFSAFEAVSKHLEVSPQHMTTVLGIPPRTIARRKAGRHLTPQESDRLYRLARAVAHTVEVLGTIEKARAWLKMPNRALGGEVPLYLLDTDIGSRQVEEVLLRLSYGIFS
jgi:putative toxin-antitoxin system antitoxin component (TIGR02293 family)